MEATTWATGPVWLDNDRAVEPIATVTPLRQSHAASSAVGFENVLLPLDGSGFSLAALPTARALAERFGADLHTIGVSRNDRSVGRLEAAGRAALGLDADPGQARVVIAADIASEIVGRAVDLGSCLVCLSTRAHGRLGAAMFDSVTRSVMSRSSDAIVAVGPSADRPGWSPPPRNWPAPLSANRIVACVDGSKASELVIPVASRWARTLGMSLTILTVIEDAPELWSSDRRTRRHRSKREAMDYVESLVHQWRESTPDVDGHVVLDPIGAASGISDYLSLQPAALVALGANRRTGLQGILHGETTAKIISASTAPCLVIPT